MDLTDPFWSGLAGRYDIQRELGAGGMAVVYLALDVQRDRLIALKVLRADLGGAASAERFHREIRTVAGLVHPNILPLLDSGETEGRLWYTMPYVEGESLRARLGREGQLGLEEAVRLTREIADALSYAHARGLLHRDIKPDNILLAEGHALVADFGIARAVAGGPDEQLTGTGVAIGTPSYMSPEQSTGVRELDSRSDLYALGSLCYEMLIGEPPFTGPTPQAVIARRLAQPPPSLSITRPTIPARVDAAVRRALATVPADRYSGTAEFAGALAEAMGGEGFGGTGTGQGGAAGGGQAPGAADHWTGDPTQAPTVSMYGAQRQSAPSLRSGQAPPPSRRAIQVLAGAALLGVAAIGYRFAIGSRHSARPASGDSTVRLAVVPFRLIGRDTGDQYLADGITGEIGSTLAGLTGLRVIAGSSVGPVAEREQSSRKIGEELDADELLEGDVQRSGDAVRVRVTLIDPATEETRWSQGYNHTSQDVFKIQSEVAEKVAAVLKIQLAERESRQLKRPPTNNGEAYDLYLRALAQSDRANNSLSSTDTVIARLTRAIALDSSFAAAWALRGASLSTSVFLGADTSRVDQAQADVHRALTLDSTLALAWYAQSDLEWNAVRGWQFEQALADARHAVALEPSLLRAHVQLGVLFLHYGFLDQARRELVTALSLDPKDGCESEASCAGISRPRIARALRYGLQLDSALAIYQSLPYVGEWVWEYATVLNGLGRPAEGLALLDSATTPGVRESNDREATRALLNASLGRTQEAIKYIALAQTNRDSRFHFHHAQFAIVCAYARMGQKALAVEWLKKTAENGMPNYPLFRGDPNLKALQGDAGYESLMAGLKTQFDAWGRVVGE
jgi:serine/threonine-protein kinase